MSPGIGATLNPGGEAPARMASTRQDHVLRARVWAPDRPARWGHPRPENKPRVCQLVTARLGWLLVAMAVGEARHRTTHRVVPELAPGRGKAWKAEPGPCVPGLRASSLQ